MALRIASVILGKKKKLPFAAQEAPASTFQNEPAAASVGGETSMFGRRASRALSSRKAGSGLLATRLY